MFNGAVGIHDRSATNGCPSVDDHPVHDHGTFANRHALVDDCIWRDDLRKGQGVRLQSSPELAPLLAQTNLTQGKHNIEFYPLGGERQQLTTRSEIRNSCHRAITLQVGITENVVALQLPKDGDHDLCVAASSDY